MIILISGISSGFGRAMAMRLSSEGHKVYGTFRKPSDVIKGVTYIKCEVTDDAQVEAAVKQVLDAEGRIDVFINNAGIGIGGPLEFTPLEDAKRQMDVIDGDGEIPALRGTCNAEARFREDYLYEFYWRTYRPAFPRALFCKQICH